MDHAQRGAKASSASDFPAAIREYTHALVVNPHAPDYYIKRSTSYSRLKSADGGPDLNAALRDAEMAVAIGTQRGRREPIVAGQMRRGVVLYQLGKLGDASFIFDFVRRKVGKSPAKTGPEAVQESITGRAAEKSSKDGSIMQELDIWEMKTKTKMASVDSSDESMKVTAKETPGIEVPDAEALKKVYQAQLDAMIGEGNITGRTSKVVSPPDAGGEVDKSNTAPTTNVSRSASAAEGETGSTSTTQPPAPSKVRHEWYQSSNTVTITLYAKGVPKDRASIDINEDSVSITFPLPTGSEFAFTLDPLYDSVDTSSSTYSIMSTKVEISLRKNQPGRKWAALEGTTEPSAGKKENVVAAPADTGTEQSGVPSSGAAPSYPTSSRKGVKDWDKIASSLTEKKKKSSSKEEDGADQDGAEDDADSDTSEYGGDPVDGFFKKLYAKADPDTQRAMVKSFYESEGTALNTNWSEVGKKKVEVQPPSGD